MISKEAIHAMLDGKKVYRKSWKNDYVDYFYFDGECFRDEQDVLLMCDFHGDDWEIYEEPKQTEILYEWLICNELNAWSISDRLRTEEEASTLFKEYDYKSWQKTGRSFEVEL